MLQTRIKKILLSAVVTLAAALGAAGPAQAAVYGGSWDPAYGGIFTDLGWRGEVTFEIPDGCPTTGNQANSGLCAGMQVLSAELSFYNIASPGVTLETFALDTSVFVNGVSFNGTGDLIGFNTGYFLPVTPDGASSSIAGNGEYSFSLILFGSSAQLIYMDSAHYSPFCASVGASGCGFSATTPTVTYAPIPEPETYALMLAGLGAVGFVARRRRRR